LSFAGFWLSNIKSKELLNWSVDYLLRLPLHGLTSLSVEVLDVVGGLNSNSISITVFLIDWHIETAPVIEVAPTILHELNATIVETCSRLRTIIQNSELHVCVLILNSDGRGDWVEVSSDVHASRNHVKWPRWSVVQLAFLHLKTIRVSPENSFVLDRCVEVHRHLLRHSVITWHSKHIHIKLDQW